MKGIANQNLADLHFEVLKPPAYSPDINPSDYYLCPNRIGRKSSTEEAKLSAKEWLTVQLKYFFLDKLKKLEHLSQKCMELKR